MTFLLPEDGAALPPIDEVKVAQYLEEEAATYREVGDFFFRNPADLGTRVLINWFNDVGNGTPERRWGTLQMLALYGLSVAESIGAFPFSDAEMDGIVESFPSDGPLGADQQVAADEVLALLQSGADATADLPDNWAIYRHVHPVVFTTACLVFAVLTLETVRAVAAELHTHPAVLWWNWINSNTER